MRRLAALAILLLTIYLGASYVVYDKLSRVVHGGGEHAANTPANFTIPDGEWKGFDCRPFHADHFERVRFRSRQSGIMLAGFYFPGDSGMPAVVVTHGISESKGDPAVLVPAGMLHRAGFSVLMPDLRNHGDSDVDDGRTTIGNREYLDVLGAWDWLRAARKLAPGRVGLYGISLGAGTTLIAFAEEPRVPATFVDSPYSNLKTIIREELVREHYPAILADGALLMARLVGHVDLLAHSPAAAVTQSRGRPIYVVHGLEDERIAFHHSKDLEALARRTGARLTAWFPAGTGHVDAALKLPAEYATRLTGFFRESLAGP